VPLVSVLMSVHDDAAFVGEAIDSILKQTLADLELIVVDDGSSDATPRVLDGYADARLKVVTNDRRLGLAASLNAALDIAQGRYVARLDADDVAVSTRLEQQVARLGNDVAIVGTAVVDLGESGERGRTHVMPQGARLLRWHALFSSPFFHPTVLVDRELLDARGLRYDPAFLESEDYELWTRLFEFANGDNMAEALVLKRVHSGQASQRRGELQRSFQQEVALREIRRVAPEVDGELAWPVGARKRARFGARREFVRLLRAFERKHGRDAGVRRAAYRALASPRARG
jgi:glycosyltransferase involved in cell wall biosynthesis